MPVDLLLDSFRKRVPWPTMRAILKMCNLPVARGWEDTITKLMAKSQGENDLENNFARLRELYCDYLLIGEKAIKLFSVERQIFNKLITLLKSQQLETTVFNQTFPFPLSEEELEKINNSIPKLVEIKDFNDNLVLIFCTKRFFTERTEINIEDLTPEARRDLNNYDEVFGVRRYNRQFFDIVVLWKKIDLLEIRIDIAHGMSLQERNKAFREIIRTFNRLQTESLGAETLLQESINFFPLIDKLYKSYEGRVCELGFTTDEGSTKFEKMRRNSVDLRTEKYHKAGKLAVNHITPYHLAIVWKFSILEEIETHPELLLPGHTRDLSDKEQYLDEILIKKCSCLEDYNFIFEKINIYLNDGG
jgi:hypothetical protein